MIDINKAKTDNIYFIENVLGIKLYKYQKEAIRLGLTPEICKRVPVYRRLIFYKRRLK